MRKEQHKVYIDIKTDPKVEIEEPFNGVVNKFNVITIPVNITKIIIITLFKC